MACRKASHLSFIIGYLFWGELVCVRGFLGVGGLFVLVVFCVVVAFLCCGGTILFSKICIKTPPLG